ncbi:hypothetical protein GC167_10125 [bacterium]|nr:hypothetical protein [bacterium]
MAVLRLFPGALGVWWVRLRLLNSLISAVALAALRWGMMQPLGMDLVLSHVEYALLMLSVVLIQSAGYVINDVFDQATDRINRPDRVWVGSAVSEEAAWRLFFGLFLAGSVLGWWVGRATLLPWPGLIPAFSGFVLYLYAAELKGKPLLGNLAVALLSGLVLLLPMCFDVLPDLSGESAGPDSLKTAVVWVSLAYAGLAFAGSLWREGVKDVEDADGDAGAGLKTAPVVWGVERMRRVWMGWGLLLVLGLGYACYRMGESSPLSALYAFVFCWLPISLALRGLTQDRYGMAQRWIKVSMGCIAISPAVFTLILFW